MCLGLLLAYFRGSEKKYFKKNYPQKGTELCCVVRMADIRRGSADSIFFLNSQNSFVQNVVGEPTFLQYWSFLL